MTELISLYNEMENHSRIRFLTNEPDVSDLMSHPKLYILFPPFTSTTTEALSTVLKTIWHDPDEFYREAPYGRNGNLVIHRYQELSKKRLEIKNMESGAYSHPVSEWPDLLDPNRDGSVIDRFRDLLLA